MPRNQAQGPQDLYDDRASSYDDSFHPRFARHMIELAKVQPGESVLDLACGTGLATVAASHAVGPKGQVVGIDISKGMLLEAEAKRSSHPLNNVKFYVHDIADLDSLHHLEGQTFDAITCCSALVLLKHPIEALRHWTNYLKPGGRIIVDVTHIQNLTHGVVMERVGRRMDRPLLWYRLNFATNDSLQKAFEVAGFVNIEVKFLSQKLHSGSKKSEELKDYIQDVESPRILNTYSIDDAGGLFDSQIELTPMKPLCSEPEVRKQAREIFCEEWAKAADADGKVREVDGVFAGIGFKP